MRRRRTLITDYLRAHDPVGGSGDQHARPAASRLQLDDTGGRAGARRTPRRLALAAGAATLAVVAVAIAAALPSGTQTPGGLLSPQAAVAAASRSLESDGILEWRELQGYSEAKRQRRGKGGRCDCWMDVTTTVDLRTGDRRLLMTSHGWSRTGRPVVTSSTQWVTGDGTWIVGGLPNMPSPGADWRLSGTDERDARGRIRVQHFTFAVGDGNDAHRRRNLALVLEKDNPITMVRETLRLARRDKAEIREGMPDGDTPTIEITRRNPSTTARTWITNESVPRLVRTTIDTRCPSGRPCDPTPDDGRAGPTIRVETRTTGWTISPRSPEGLATIARPVFDRSRYAVRHLDLGALGAQTEPTGRRPD